MAAQMMSNNQVTMTDALWQTFLPLLYNGTINDLVVPGVHQAIIGNQGINLLSARLANFVQAPTTVEVDAYGIYRIYAKRDPSGRRSVSDKGTAVSKPLNGNKGQVSQAKLPRPANSFILYRQHHHPLIKAEQPHLHNNQISAILGKQWMNESAAVKEEFKALAEKLKRQHFLEHPDYQYRPRKPSEKKRRMTRRKAMASAAGSSQSSAVKAGALVPSAVAQVPQVPQAPQAPMGPMLPGGAVLQGGMNTNAASSSAPPGMELTSDGNLLFSLGEESITNKDLYEYLGTYNAGMSDAMTNTNQVMVPGGTPVLYDELSQDAQDDFNFYSGMISFNQEEDLLNEEFMADELMQSLGGPESTWNAVDAASAVAAFDAVNDATQDTELFRTYTHLD